MSRALLAFALLVVLAPSATAQRAVLQTMVRDTVFANGLHVIAVRSPSAPFATIKVVVRTGAFSQLGNVSRPTLEQAITKTLGTLPRGNYTWTLPAPWVAQKTEIVAHARQLPTNYILGRFGGPIASSKDYPAFQLTTAVLSSLMSSAIRSRGLSYSSYAPMVALGASGGGIYSSTVRPDSVIMIVNDAIRVIEEGLVQRAAILATSEGYLSRFELTNELNSSKAAILARAHLYDGDHRVAGQYGDVIRKIGTTDVRRMARTYMKNIQYAYLGDTTKVPRKEMVKR